MKEITRLETVNKYEFFRYGKFVLRVCLSTVQKMRCLSESTMWHCARHSKLQLRKGPTFGDDLTHLILRITPYLPN
jgi:hypothetical protein